MSAGEALGRARDDADERAAGVLLACAGAMALASLLLVYAVLRLRAQDWPGPPAGAVLPCAGLVLLGVAARSARASRALPLAAGAGFLLVQWFALRGVPAAGAGPGAVFWALSLAHAVSVLVALGRSAVGARARGSWAFAAGAWAVIVLAVWGL